MKEIRTPIGTVKIPPGSSPLVVQHTEAGPPKRITMLVYGAPGCGKTTLASTFPKPFFIDVQGGLMSVRHKNVAYVRPESYEDLLQCLVPENLPAGCETTILDTATHTVMLIMNHVMRTAKHELATRLEWSATIEYTKRVVGALVSLPTHVVMTAEESIDKDEEIGKILGGPDLPPSLQQKLPALFDCVFHLRIGLNPKTQTKGRWLLTEPEGIFFARDRLGGLDRLEVPDFNHLWSKVTK